MTIRVRTAGRTIAAFALLPVLAVGLRLLPAKTDPISYDEAFSWRLASLPVGDLVRRTAADVHPPLYYLVLKAWWSGDSPLALRAPSALLGGLTVVFVWLATAGTATLGRGRPGRATMAVGVAALLVAVHPYHVQIGHTARMYPLGTALAASSWWLLVRALGRGGPRAWAGWAITATLFLWTHNYAVFSIAAEGLAATALIVAKARRG